MNSTNLSEEIVFSKERPLPFGLTAPPDRSQNGASILVSEQITKIAKEKAAYLVRPDTLEVDAEVGKAMKQIQIAANKGLTHTGLYSASKMVRFRLKEMGFKVRRSFGGYANVVVYWGDPFEYYISFSWVIVIGSMILTVVCIPFFCR